MVSFFLPLVLLPLVQFSNQKKEFLPMVHSCLWCCNIRNITKNSLEHEMKVECTGSECLLDGNVENKYYAKFDIRCYQNCREADFNVSIEVKC